MSGAPSRILLLLLAALMVTPAVTEAATWPAGTLRVYDTSGSRWAAFVKDAVAHYNARLPQHAPTLVYTPTTGACQDRSGAITVCVVPAATMTTPGAWGETPLVRRDRVMRQATIHLSQDATPNLALVCHELFHAMGVIEHGAWTAVRPCPYDAASMEQMYGKDAKKPRKPHRKHRRKR